MPWDFLNWPQLKCNIWELKWLWSNLVPECACCRRNLNNKRFRLRAHAWLTPLTPQTRRGMTVESANWLATSSALKHPSWSPQISFSFVRVRIIIRDCFNEQGKYFDKNGRLCSRQNLQLLCVKAEDATLAKVTFVVLFLLWTVRSNQRVCDSVNDYAIVSVQKCNHV